MTIQLSELQVCLNKGYFISAEVENGETKLSRKTAIKISKAESLPERVKEKILQDAQLITLDVLKRFQGRSLRELSEEERDKIRDIVDFTAGYIKILGQKFRRDYREEMRKLDAMALCAKLGGRVAVESLMDPCSKEFVAFVQSNFLHHKMQALGHQCGALPSLCIEGFEEPILWKDFVKTERLDEKGEVKGYIFSYEGKTVFETDLKYKCTDAYTYIDGKIAKYNPLSSQTVRHYDTQQGDGTYSLEIHTALHKSSHFPQGLFLEGHSHLVLIDNQGRRFGVGQYGMADDFDCQHALSAFGKKRGGIETPDRYLMLPKSSHYNQKVTISLEKEQYVALMAQIVQDKADPNLTVSLIQGNCTSYVRKLLKGAGIRVETRMPIFYWLVRKMLPSILTAPLDESLDALSPFWRKTLTFFPLIYVPSVVLGLIVCCGSMHNFQKSKPEFSLIDVFFRPWRMTADSPVRLKLWQDKYMKQSRIK